MDKIETERGERLANNGNGNSESSGKDRKRIKESKKYGGENSVVKFNLKIGNEDVVENAEQTKNLVKKIKSTFRKMWLLN